jgi:hypothetical protein
MHKNATKCNKTQSKWCINKHGASKIIDTFETYQGGCGQTQKREIEAVLVKIGGGHAAGVAPGRFSGITTIATNMKRE